MPNAYVLNQKPTTYGRALSLLTEMLFNAGWSYQTSGDGLASTGAGKIFTNFTNTTPGTALSWNNSGAWVRMQDPGGIREFTFQHDNARNVRFKYSASSKFTTGGSATATPSAADERVFRGSGTDASPTYNAWFSTSVVATPPTVIHQGAAMSAAPYGFWFCSQVQGTQLINQNPGKASTLMFDPVTTVAGDTDPYVIHVASNFGFGTTFNTTFANDGGSSTNAATVWAQLYTDGNADSQWAHMDTAKSQYLYVQPAMYTSQISSLLSGTNGDNLIAGGGAIMYTTLGLNPFNGKSDMLPIPYLRVASSNTSPGTAANTQAPALKGWSTLMRWTGLSRNSFMDTMDNKAWICVGAVWVPWDGTTQPIA